jgi:iron(III) transport system permease protein
MGNLPLLPHLPLAAGPRWPAHCAVMSHAFARTVFVATAAFFAAFFLWPVLQILKGGFVDADGHFTLTFLTALEIYVGDAGFKLVRL